MSRDDIVMAALTMIEEDGLEAFSTRKLGARLGMQAMSLYHYFPNREALLDTAVEHMIAELPMPNVSRIGWRQGLLRLATDYRAMGLRHIRAVPLLVLRCPAAPAMQRFLDTLSRLLAKAGLRQAEVAHWLLIQRDYVVGSLMSDHSAHLLAIEQTRAGAPATDGNAAIRMWADADVRERAFKKGFTAMLDAIERQR